MAESAKLQLLFTISIITAIYSGGRTAALPPRTNFIPLRIQVINLCQSGSLKQKGITKKDKLFRNKYRAVFSDSVR